MTGSGPELPTGLTMRTRDVADRSRNGDPLLLDGQLLDRRGLQVVEHLARLRRLELVEERRGRRRVDDPLGGRLENDPGLNGHC